MLFRKQNALTGLYKASNPTNLQVTEQLELGHCFSSEAVEVLPFPGGFGSQG